MAGLIIGSGKVGLDEVGGLDGIVGSAQHTGLIGGMGASAVLGHHLAGGQAEETLHTDAFSAGGFNPTIQSYDANWNQHGAGGNIHADHEAQNAYANTSTEACAFWDGDTFANDQFAEAEIAGTNSFVEAAGIAVCCQSGSTSSYYGYWSRGSGGTAAEFFRSDSGTRTTLVSGPAVASQGDVVRLERVGTNVNLYINGVLEESVTDATYTGGFPGVCGFNSSRGGRAVDNFVAGNVEIAPVATLAGLKGTQSATATLGHSATSAQSGLIATQAASATLGHTGTSAFSAPLATMGASATLGHVATSAFSGFIAAQASSAVLGHVASSALSGLLPTMAATADVESAPNEAAFTGLLGTMASSATAGHSATAGMAGLLGQQSTTATINVPIAKWAIAPEVRYTNSADVLRCIVVAAQRQSLGEIERVDFAVSVNGGAASTTQVSTRGDHKPTDTAETDPLPGWAESGGTGPFPVPASFALALTMSDLAVGTIDVTPTVVPANGDTPRVLDTYRFYNHRDGTTLSHSGTVRYVSTTGNDSTGDGTSGNPFASMNRACQHAKDGSSNVSDLTIYLMGQDTHHDWGGGSATGNLNTAGGGYLHIRPAPGVTRVYFKEGPSAGLQVRGTAVMRVWIHRGIVHEGHQCWFVDESAKTTWIVDETEKQPLAANIQSPPSIRVFADRYNTATPWQMLNEGTKRDIYLGSYIHDMVSGPWGAWLDRGGRSETMLGIKFSGSQCVINHDLDRITRLERGYVNLSNVPVDITIPVAGTMRVAEQSAGALATDLEDIGLALAGQSAVRIRISGAPSGGNNSHFIVTGSGNTAGKRWLELANASVVAESDSTVSIRTVDQNNNDWTVQVHGDCIFSSTPAADQVYWNCRFANVDNEGRGIGTGSTQRNIVFFSVAIDFGDLTAGTGFNAWCVQLDLGAWTNLIWRRCTFRGSATFANVGYFGVELAENVWDGVSFQSGIDAAGFTSQTESDRNHFNGTEPDAFGSNQTSGATWSGTALDGDLVIAGGSSAKGAANWATGSALDSGDLGALVPATTGDWTFGAAAAFTGLVGQMAASATAGHSATAAFVGLLPVMNASAVAGRSATASFTGLLGQMAASANGAGDALTATAGFAGLLGQLAASGTLGHVASASFGGLLGVMETSATVPGASLTGTAAFVGLVGGMQASADLVKPRGRGVGDPMIYGRRPPPGRRRPWRVWRR